MRILLSILSLCLFVSSFLYFSFAGDGNRPRPPRLPFCDEIQQGDMQRGGRMRPPRQRPCRERPPFCDEISESEDSGPQRRSPRRRPGGPRGPECIERPASIQEGGGSAPSVQQIGTCQKHAVTGASLCVPAYPVPTDPFFNDYFTCKTSAPYDVAQCLREWAENKKYTICGSVVPTTEGRIAGSGEIEVPYSGSVGRTLHEQEIMYQCDRKIPPADWSLIMEAIRAGNIGRN